MERAASLKHLLCFLQKGGNNHTAYVCPWWHLHRKGSWEVLGIQASFSLLWWQTAKSHPFPSNKGGFPAEFEKSGRNSSRCFHRQQMMPLPFSSLGSHPLEPTCDCIPGLFQGWSFIPGTLKPHCLPSTSPDHCTRNNKLFLVLFAAGRYSVWSIQAGRAGLVSHCWALQLRQGWAVLPASHLRWGILAGYRGSSQGTLNWELQWLTQTIISSCVKQDDQSPHQICADQTGTAVHIITSTFFKKNPFFPLNCIMLFW